MVIASVVGIALSIVVMIILTWVAIFGGVGAAIASSFGKSPVIGFAFGSLLGPLGWLVTWLTGRKNGCRAQPSYIQNPTAELDSPSGGPAPVDTRDDWFGDD